ncbi:MULTISPECIES: aconitate hydratase AcnA [Thiorhodovibrio]|uniref:aconitate hydratase AcnA n=1 Tax=Thiorhodovibrio TaxID=61593 RepID=UPI0019141013|nr:MULTISPECIES: aconitate hydratase AcnA [Thiorhodovibrio]MBK5967709.1 aconitate hydratase 1 [Thiorhodovibrio winogradskyi]WPL11657.1 Aconitate hydratase [Thiorhodovibrio litoralis]
MSNSFNARAALRVGDQTYDIFRLDAVPGSERLPFSLKILLENLLRHEDGVSVRREDIEALAQWDPQAEPATEIQYRPARVLMQDFTGVPAIVDLAAMRDAMSALGGDPERINPLQPAELVIDHSVQVDYYASDSAFAQNAEMEFSRNRERYAFLKWGQTAFDNFQVVPPDTGIVHQVNVEYLARVIFSRELDGQRQAYPDTLVGTDSHTTMINGVGVLGWGVGGIEAEASMLGQPISMLIPQVVGMRLTGELPEGTTATDLVLTIVERLRQHGVVGKFVEFFGPAVATLPMGERTTIANMAPEYGATCGLFPIDQETLKFLRMTGRDPDQVALVEAYAKEQGFFASANSPEPQFTQVLELDIGTVVPCLAGPKRPQDRVALTAIKGSFATALQQANDESGREPGTPVSTEIDGQPCELRDGSVVIAAITSCTNTSNPSVMLAAGLVAQKAVARGLRVPPWVKTSLGPGSMVVTRYLEASGLLEPLKQLGFHVVGYGCTTCIGNSGPLRPEVSSAIAKGNLSVTSVLSGNRNFEGRVHAEVRMNYLASPPLVVAYALAGRMGFDPYEEPLATDTSGQAVYLKDLWPSQAEIRTAIEHSLNASQFSKSYAEVFAGDTRWQELAAPEGQRYDWAADSTYIQHPPYFEGMSLTPEPVAAITGGRCLAILGDSVTTDHISPAGAIKADGPAGRYLIEQGVAVAEFNSYGSRRGNHEVMMRGTFANIRLRNKMAPGTEGGVTLHQPSGEQLSIYDAAMRYQSEGVPAIIIAGKEYGSGSSRDWAAKGPRLLGVRAVIAESFERIHRTNLVCMGILPLQFAPGDSAETLGLTGGESFDIGDIEDGDAKQVQVTASGPKGTIKSFTAKVRIDTPNEADYYRHGSILHYVLRRLAGA